MSDKPYPTVLDLEQRGAFLARRVDAIVAEYDKRIAALESLAEANVFGHIKIQPQPVVGYDPAVSAMCGVTLRDSDGDPVGLCSEDARTIVAAIRAGKVYGLGDVSALRAELVACQKELAEAEQRMHGLVPGHLLVEADKRIDALTAQRDTARAELAEAKANVGDLVPSAWGSAAQAMGAKPVEWNKPQPVAANPTCKQSLQVGQPVADDVAVQALSDILSAWDKWEDYDGKDQKKDICRAVLNAIRAGKVPGVYAGLHASDAVIDGLRAELAAAEEKLAKHMADSPLTKVDAEYLTERLREAAEEQSKLRSEMHRAQDECNALRIRLSDISLERDIARARCVVLEGLLRRYADRMNAVNGDVGPAFIAELRIDIDAALGKDGGN